MMGFIRKVFYCRSENSNNKLKVKNALNLNKKLNIKFFSDL